MLIAELEKRSGLSRDTIRYYEKIKLLETPSRRVNGYRDYAAGAIKTLRFIATARAIGFSLEDIRPALPKLSGPVTHCTDLLKKLEQRRSELQAAIEAERQRLAQTEMLIAKFSGEHPSPDSKSSVSARRPVKRGTTASASVD